MATINYQTNGPPLPIVIIRAVLPFISYADDNKCRLISQARLKEQLLFPQSIQHRRSIAQTE